MSTHCIAVVDASRARLFTFRRTAGAEGIDEKLVEERDLINPARRRTPDLFSTTRPGVNRTGRSGTLQYGLDDHREQHVEKLDSEFARMVMKELSHLLSETHSQHAIICASPKMLGELRDAKSALAKSVALDEIARDLVKLTPPQLRNQLADYGML